MVSKRIAWVAVLLLMIAACAPQPTSTPVPPTSTTLPTATATLTPTRAPTNTPTPPPPSPTETPAPTLTHAESVMRDLPTLPGYTWQVKGDAVSLVDGNGNSVATYDEKNGGVQWDSKNHFDKINAFLTTEDGKKALAAFLGGVDIHFVSYAASPEPGNLHPAPWVVTARPDHSVQLVRGAAGTDHFTYDMRSQKVKGAFADDTAYFNVKADGSLDFAPVEDLANGAKMDSQFTPAEQQQIRTALLEIFKSGIFSYSDDEIMSMTKNDFRTSWNNRFRDTYPNLDFDTVSKLTRIVSPAQLLSHLVSFEFDTKAGIGSLWRINKNRAWVGLDHESFQGMDYIKSMMLKELEAGHIVYVIFGNGMRLESDYALGGEKMSFFRETGLDAIMKNDNLLNRDIKYSLTDTVLPPSGK